MRVVRDQLVQVFLNLVLNAMDATDEGGTIAITTALVAATAWDPVVGDEVYGSGRDKTVSDPIVRSKIAQLNRQFLHAEKLRFRHPHTNKEISFSADLPAELSVLLDLVRD